MRHTTLISLFTLMYYPEGMGVFHEYTEVRVRDWPHGVAVFGEIWTRRCLLVNV